MLNKQFIAVSWKQLSVISGVRDKADFRQQHAVLRETSTVNWVDN